MAKFIPALSLAICLASAGACGAQEMSKPLGKWERKIGKNRVTLTIEDHRLHISCAGESVVVLHADFATTHDGVIYGVVTSIEVDEAEEAEAAKTLFDAPFSFRYRIDEGALIIHDVKSSDDNTKDDLLNGRFKAVRPAADQSATSPTPPPYSNHSSPLPPSASPPPPTPIGSSFSTPPEAQMFNFWLGSFSR